MNELNYISKFFISKTFGILPLLFMDNQYIFQVIEERDVISNTRRKKNRKRQKLESEEERWEKLNKQKM